MALHLTLDGERHTIEILQRRPRLRLAVDGREYEIVGDWIETTGRLDINGRPVGYARALVHETRETAFVRLKGRTHEVELVDPREESAGHEAVRDEMHAPMPGAVISVHRNVGDQVMRGETIITIESMKLQTALTSPRDGRLLEIRKAVGEKFDKDDVLAKLAPVDGV